FSALAKSPSQPNAYTWTPPPPQVGRCGAHLPGVLQRPERPRAVRRWNRRRWKIFDAGIETEQWNGAPLRNRTVDLLLTMENRRQLDQRRVRLPSDLAARMSRQRSREVPRCLAKVPPLVPPHRYNIECGK